MELLHGQPLAGPLPLARALALAGQILAALTAAHRRALRTATLSPSLVQRLNKEIQSDRRDPCALDE
jgi:hypothetical protein